MIMRIGFNGNHRPHTAIIGSVEPCLMKSIHHDDDLSVHTFDAYYGNTNLSRNG